MNWAKRPSLKVESRRTPHPEVSFRQSKVTLLQLMLRRYHSQILPVRNDKRHMPIYSETKLMFIQDINNLSGDFMPSLCAFLWSDKHTDRDMRKNARAFTTKRKYVLPETQLRFTSNTRAFGSKCKGV